MLYSDSSCFIQHFSKITIIHSLLFIIITSFLYKFWKTKFANGEKIKIYQMLSVKVQLWELKQVNCNTRKLVFLTIPLFISFLAVSNEAVRKYTFIFHKSFARFENYSKFNVKL